MTRITLAAAGLLALTIATGHACDTFDTKTAFLIYQADGINMQTQAMGGGRAASQADVHEVFDRMDRRVTAAVASCKRGELISIPRMFVNRYCDFGKHIEHERDGMASCVKAK